MSHVHVFFFRICFFFCFVLFCCVCMTVTCAPVCPPCSFSLHSHSMTNVKRISSLRENSPSTRTKRVSRTAVTLTVSKLSDTSRACFHAGGGVSVSLTCSSVLGRAAVRGCSSLAWMPIALAEERPSCSLSCDVTSIHTVELVRPIFSPPPPPPGVMSAHFLPACSLSCCTYLPLLAAGCSSRARSPGPRLPLLTRS